ncbi:MAG TPA: flagellar motor protein MotB [Verrucomicrobiales bacterium]|nr:flagellar motor protein MotB [Verrucomicrobiales bacterium]
MAGSGGAWKVAYADFVTAMMALFLVLWLVSQDTSVREAVEKAFRSQFVTTAPGTASLIQKTESPAIEALGDSKNSDSPLEAAVLRKVLDQLQALNMPVEGENRPIQLRVTPEGLEISVFDRAKRPLFVGETEKLTMYGRWVFSTLAWPIAENLNSKIELAGHTPEGFVTTSGDYSAWELSADRAKVARRALVRYGVREEQINKVSGYGSTRPMADTDPADEENRRVTVLFRLPAPHNSYAVSNQ